ncbi:putative nonsense-mediated mRNA decay factor [Peziza echinospora]|nr:putative nonsense-mediated mRNA decay factor [Peziza echinospora]
MALQLTRSRKRELAELNKRAWQGQTDVFKTQSSLDSSLKKNTAVIKRLRTQLTGDSLPTILKELATISLEKYLSEVISAVADGLQKVKTSPDITAAVETVSALHQRFHNQFTPYLTYAIAKGLATPRPDVLKPLSPEQKEREEKERLSRQRVLLRVAVELWLVGVIRTLDDALVSEEVSGKSVGGSKTASGSASTPAIAKRRERADGETDPFPMDVLKDLLGRDREHVNLPLVVLFVKNFSFDLLGVKPRSTTPKHVEEDGETTEGASKNSKSTNANRGGADGGTGDGTEYSSADENEQPLVKPDLQKRFRNILERYLTSVQAHIVRQHTFLKEQSQKNTEAYIKSGEVFEDRQSNYEKLVKAQEKFIANAQTVADVLGMDMPDLPTDSGDSGIGDSIIREGGSMFAPRGEEGRAGIWEDEDQKKFYEDLVDLKNKVPGIFLEDGKKKKGSEGEDEKVKKANGTTAKTEADSNAPANGESQQDKTEDTSTTISNKKIGAQVDALLIRLPELTNRDLIDQAAVDFCFLNSKASRNRLLKVLEEVPRGRQDLLPYYSRLVATLNKYMPDIGTNLVNYLDKEFRSLQKRKEKELGEVRARNIRYLSELTKFGVVPQHVIFHCLKVAMDDFTRVNIDVICNILENCGRYLLRNTETNPRMTTFLETLHRKKTAQHLGPQDKILIENAFYYVNPPERAAIQQKERSPMELFVRKLIYLDLTKRNYVKILKQIRKLHWELPETQAMLLKIFTKIWKVRFNNIHILAILVGALAKYHGEFSVAVVDDILEQIEVGLEQNNFKHNQRRIAQVKYLGELYNYKMVDSQVIFESLYRLTAFGHENGTPKPGKLCYLDMPDDFFRIRLVCTLLDVCGMCFEKGSAKKKLDFFLTFFQYYIYTKEPMPMDVEFLVQDTFQAIRPNWKLHTNLEDAAKSFEEAVSKTFKPSEEKSTAEPEEVEEEAESSDEGGDGGDDDDHRDEDEAQLSDDDGETQTVASREHEESSSESEEEDIVVQLRQEERDPEADAEFDRELAKMMADSLESRKFDRKPVFDVPLPFRRVMSREPTMGSEAGDVASPTEGKMAFSLLTKKGNRQQTRTVELPSDSSFAIAMRSQQEAEREEQQRIKNLVLNYERMEESNDSDAEKHAGLIAAYRYDKGSKNAPRSRKLTLSDVNW